MTVHHRIFESASKSWEQLSKEAEEFASNVGRENLINISLAAAGGTEAFGVGGRGLVIVWYWA
jgi:hypothetical protein